MKWSAKLGRFAGIDVYVHATFLLLLLWIGMSSWARTGSPVAVAASLALVVLLFLCVVLHEYGHALTARRFGIGTRSITVLPIGGLALLETMPRDPWQEIVVALAGPAVNLAIAAGLFVLIVIGSRPGSLLAFDPITGALLPTLLTANLMLALFNLLPAFPMDGGRVFRAALALRMDRVRATRLAARVGQVLAVGFAILGWFQSPILLLIAVFVWIGAGAEARAAEAEARAEAKAAEARRADASPDGPRAGPWDRPPR